jgi:hypothetical protein
MMPETVPESPYPLFYLKYSLYICCMEIMEKILDWIVAMDFAHYVTEEFPDYKPDGPSHWYIKGSPERFTSDELIKIYNGEMDNKELRERWHWALTDKK